MTSLLRGRWDGRLARRNPVGWLIATGIIAIAAIALATTMAVSSFRERALQSATRELENTLVLLTRHFDQQFDDLRRTRNSVQSYLRSNGVASAKGFAAHMPSYDAHLMLRAKTDDNNWTGTLQVLDADGRLIAWTPSWPAPQVDLGDRGYFQTLKNSDPATDAEIVEPVLSRITHTWKTVFARRLDGPNGEFLGVITRNVEPILFQRFFASLALGAHTTITMMHSDGAMLARYPQADHLIGRKFPFNGVLSRGQAERPRTLRVASPIDGRDRLTAVWRLRDFPVSLVATVTVDSALADWRAQTKFLIGAATLLALVFASLLLLIIRQVKRRHRTAQAQMTLEKQRLDTAINNMTQGLMLFDTDGRVVVVNQSYLDMYKVSADVVRPGCHFRDAVAQRQANGSFDADADVDAYITEVMGDIQTRRTTTINAADGRVIQVLSQPIADGGWVATHEDITERRHVEQRIAHLAHYDTLTDLPNRTLFHQLLTQQLDGIGRGRHCAVIYIDMDEFKGINDSLGHSVGDALLMAVAERLKGCVSGCDAVARLGGDEFAIVQSDIHSPEETIALVERIHGALREPFECLGHRLLTDASIGVALAPQDGSGLDQLLRNADLAMYAAKADGRRTYRFFEPDMDARVQARRLLEHDLREAVADGDFRKGGFDVHYQPLLRLTDDAVPGCEALLRWQHPVRGMVSPAEFIPIAEDIGVINQLGEWVLTTACMEAANWPGDIRIAVNVSPVQFRSATLALRVVAALGASGLSPQRLELEITEAVLIHDDDAALAILHRLRALGVRIALDDFGTGYSSLSYLQRFPFDKIKIDRAFVTDITGPNGASSIVQAVVNIAASRNMTTTAEGVETEAQKTLLRSLGCTEMQGWLFSAARPAAEVRALIAAHSPQRKVA
jgi:diguanylate cyclase (GGDEF)-like protein